MNLALKKTAPQKVRTCLWFQERGLEAARFYTSLLPNSALDEYEGSGVDDPVVVNFTLAGVPYQILNGGPHYQLTPAVSISVLTEDQAETDHLWNALIGNDGTESQCAWLTDRWGVSWQIVPMVLIEMLTSQDREAAGRAQEAMLHMTKIDINTLVAAFGATPGADGANGSTSK